MANTLDNLSPPPFFARWIKCQRRFLMAFLCICASPLALAAENLERVGELLGGMSEALREQSYQGLFTYEHGGALETLKLLHQVADGVEVSSLERLNGPAQRYSPKARKADCLSPSDRRLRGGADVNSALADLAGYYHFYIREDQRVAGREATVLQAVPRDEYRFGHTFTIDKATSLPLGAMIFTPNKTVLERLQFVDLSLLAEAEPLAVAPTTFVCQSEPVPQAPWQLGWMPSGFVAAGVAHREVVGDMMMFTDGLASFSVFIRPSIEDVVAQGQAQRGATVAFMQQHRFGQTVYTVSVVGEVPVRTAQRIASSVRPMGQS